MARLSKEEIARLEGMRMAYEIAKEHGIEGLEAEVKWRGALNICPQVNAKKIYEVVDMVCDKERMMLGTASAWAMTEKLHLPMSMLDIYLENMNNRLQEYKKDRTLQEQDAKLLCGDVAVMQVTDKFEKEIEKDGSYRVVKKG